MRPKISEAIPTDHDENDQSDDEVCDRTGERVDEMANAEVLCVEL